MRQSLATEQPRAESVRHSRGAAGFSRFEQPEVQFSELGVKQARLCLTCHKPLERCNAKVHPGHCARVRKSQLQKLGRWRGRR